MATGYMGMEEPEVAPKGSPETNPPTPETMTQVGTPAAQAEQVQAEPAKVEPVVKELVAATEKVAEPAAEAAKAEPTPRVVEKVVEKIIEKYPEFKGENEKALYEAFVNGDTDKVFNYLSEIKKNYDTMSDIDVVRERLGKVNPAWTKEDIELELRAEYGKQLEQYNMDDFDKETDPEGYKEALAHNEKVEQNTLRLQRAARDGRVALKEAQKTIELPKIKNEEPQAAAPIAPTQEQLDEAVQNWKAMAETQVEDLADYKFEVGDDKNPEEVVFAVTPEDKQARVESMKSWNGKDFMAQRGWQNADGSFNLLSIAKDVHTLENIDKMQKSAYTQGLTNGRKAEVAKIKNIDTELNRADAPAPAPQSAGDLVWG